MYAMFRGPLLSALAHPGYNNNNTQPGPTPSFSETSPLARGGRGLRRSGFIQRPLAARQALRSVFRCGPLTRCAFWIAMSTLTLFAAVLAWWSATSFAMRSVCVSSSPLLNLSTPTCSGPVCDGIHTKLEAAMSSMTVNSSPNTPIIPSQASWLV